MKKFIITGFIVALSIMFTIPAMADITNDANATVTGTTNSSSTIENGAFQDNRTYEGSISQATKMKRYYAPAGDVNYPNSPNMFGGATPSYMDRLKVKDLLDYNEDGLTTAMQMSVLKNKSGGKNVMVRSFFGEVKKEDRMDADAPMGVTNVKDPTMRSLGTITVVSDSTGSISPDVFARIQVEAWKLGGRKLHVKAEGFQREVHNEGAGFGFSWTGSTISGGQSSATTGVMGFGKSWGQAGYYDHPFIVVHVLVAK